jgi:hypothetical protein
MHPLDLTRILCESIASSFARPNLLTYPRQELNALTVNTTARHQDASRREDRLARHASRAVQAQ